MIDQARAEEPEEESGTEDQAELPAEAAPEPEPSEPAGPSAPAGDFWASEKVQAVVEALLFASPDVMSFRNLRKILPEDEVPSDDLRAALTALQDRYESRGSGVVLQEVAGGWQFVTRETCHEWVQRLARTRTEEKITAAALETLSIVAYKQPITRAEVDAIRGVGSGQMIRTLMDKKMVKVVGRVDLPGRPFQYGTTRQFLEHFGLRALRDLPQGKDL
ncbi:MAG: SMC-Scp complex subunit ScpB [Planctomycetes bacterium]|nr:SMC-Scp complex subunit ScpB [Planctomycetota bacterium]